MVPGKYLNCTKNLKRILMENPSQSPYTIEELFRLKPEVIQELAENAAVPVMQPPADPPNAIAPEQPIKNAFWPKYKWYFIVGGIFLVGGISWFIYHQKQKKKKNIQKIDCRCI